MHSFIGPTVDINSQQTSNNAAADSSGRALPLERPGFLPIRTSFHIDENSIPKSMFSPFTPSTPFSHSNSPIQDSSVGYFDRPRSRRDVHSFSKTTLNVVVQEGQVEDVDLDDLKDGWGTARQVRAETLEEWQSTRDQLGLSATTSPSVRTITTSRSPLLARVLSFSSSSPGSTPMTGVPRASTRPTLCKSTTNHQFIPGSKTSTINSSFELKQARLI